MIDVLANVECPYCANNIKVNCKDYIAGTTSTEKSEGMGIDTQWIIESKPMCCPVCNNEIVLLGTVGIYPEDTVEFVDVRFKKS